jgi:predicted component of type VI protein secretion system
MTAAIDLAACAARWDAGATARSSAGFEALTAEIAMLEAPDGEVAWPAVREHAQAVIECAPDLLAASYLAHALQQLDGLDGLTAGLELVRDLLRDHWEVLQPAAERARGRRSALVWLGERALRALPAEPAAHARCLAAAREAEAACVARFGEPLIAPLRRRLEHSEPSLQQSPSAPTPAPVAPLAMDRDEAIAQLREALAYFQRCEPHSPIGPLLRRALAWCELGFEEVFRELLARAPEARNALWETLGLKAPAAEAKR